ncbi:MAG: hypothetical protein ACLFUE_05895, partial [Desulfobacteraceae bacterium]
DEAPEVEISPEMPPGKIWQALEAVEGDGDFAERFNALDHDTRLEVADYVLSSCNVFSGRPALFSKYYDAESATLTI